MTDFERKVLLDLLNQGRATHFWVTRNFLVENWDGSVEWTRLMYPPERGIAKVETDKVRDSYGDEHQCYMTEDAGYFVQRIVKFC
jgi:hypothetical protein